jgi:hypothetical protein
MTMTVREFYEQSVKPMADPDRAELVELILSDLSSEPLNTPHNEEELIAMLEDGMDSKLVPLTADTWTEYNRRIATRPKRKS